MTWDVSEPSIEKALDQVLGYLNFSAGAPDPKTLAALNQLHASWEDSIAPEPQAVDLHTAIRDALVARLPQLSAKSSAFADSRQAGEATRLVFDLAIPAYFAHHRDLLFHQTPSRMINGFFLGRMMEAVLQNRGEPDETGVVEAALRQLNDYVGFRPVATLESHKGEPYPHERLRPVPLYVKDVGPAAGRHRKVVEIALGLIAAAPETVLTAACFDLAQLEEFAVDPRAYDFDHPANKRPNHHFGMWDPHQIDRKGRYRRFVTQETLLEALIGRIETETDKPRAEIEFEAAAVLAGTMLMASGICGWGPDTYDSTVSISSLLGKIARYRDEFYRHLIERIDGPHAKRLRAEAKEKRQPFGGARQHLNAELARRRALQLQHAHLARATARIGLAEAAARHANVIPCASARMMCRIDCLLAEVDEALRRHDPRGALERIESVERWIERGIECGALVDPWNILAFDGHFPLWHGPESGVHDGRIDDAIDLMDRLFAACSRVWNEAVALGDDPLAETTRHKFHGRAQWWRTFAAHEVSSVEAVDPIETFEAARRVAEALRLWHHGDGDRGRTAANVKFWTPHAAMFDSPKAYAMVIEALLEQRDPPAAMALLVHWASRADEIPLARADASFHDLSRKWFAAVRDRSATPTDAMTTVGKLVDYLEANAESWWKIPVFEARSLGGDDSASNSTDDDPDDDRDEDAGPFDAAYDEMKDWRDSADDGVDGSIAGDTGGHDELAREAKRISERLDFHSTLASLWRSHALLHAAKREPTEGDSDEAAKVDSDRIVRWIAAAEANRASLIALLEKVERWRLPKTSGDHESMVDYYREQTTKEHLLEKIAGVCVEVADSARLLRGAAALVDSPQTPETDDLDVAELAFYAPLYSALFRRDGVALRRLWGPFLDELAKRPLLYVPLNKRGKPEQVVRVRARQHAIEDLLCWMPKLGLILETCQLIETAREMERGHSVGPGAVSEFDELFKIGYRSIVEALIDSSSNWTLAKPDEDEQTAAEDALVSCMEQLTESLLATWLAHSRTLRLSALEKAMDRKTWKRLVEFVERHGAELFTQRFLNLANVRAILHQGVRVWLDRVREEPPRDAPGKFLEALDGDDMPDTALDDMTLILEAVNENFGEYRDYSSTTTQSDRGEMIYTWLDFLRLRTKYDRVCWNLKPVVLAHDILLRRGCDEAARVWRRALSERISDEADGYLKQLAQLQKKHAMKMPTIADRLAERFTRPLAVDRVRALVKPAIEEVRAGGPSEFSESFESEVQELARTPGGAGFDVPPWVAAVEDEIDRQTRGEHDRTWEEEIRDAVPSQPMTLEDVQSQLDAWSTRK